MGELKSLFSGFSKAFAKKEGTAAVNATKNLFSKALSISEKEVKTITTSKMLTKERGFWKFGGLRPGNIVSKLRAGKFSKLFEEMNIKVKDSGWISSKEEYLRKTNLQQSPDYHFTVIEEKIASNYKDISNKLDVLNTKVNNIKSLPPQAQDQVLKWMIRVKVGGGILLTTALVGTGIGLLVDQTQKTMSKMEGCYFLKKEGDNVNKYKIQNRTSKEYPPVDEQLAYEKVFRNKPLPYNINLQLRYILKNPKGHEEFIRTYEHKLDGLKGNENGINDFVTENFETLQTHFDTHKVIEIGHAFDLLNNTEKENRKCVGCDPTASMDSIDYVCLDDMAINESIRCVNNVTVLEAMMMFGKNSITTILEGVADAFGLRGIWSKIGIFTLIALAIVIAGQFLIARFTVSNPYEQLNEDDYDIDVKQSEKKT